MAIARAAAVMAYMRAQVRMHAADARHVNCWSADEVAAAFHTLSGPLTPFETWCASAGLELEATQEQTLEANEQALKQLKLRELAERSGIMIEDLPPAPEPKLEPEPEPENES